MFGILRSIGLIFVTVLVTIFCIQNLASAEVALFVWSLTAPRALVYFCLFGLGWIAGYLAHTFRPRAKPTGQT